MLTAHVVEDNQHLGARNVKEFSGEELKLGWVVGVGGVAFRILKCTRYIISDVHVRQVPQVARAVPVITAANRVPVARGVRALPAVVGSRPKILRPEEWLARLVDEPLVVGKCTPE